MTRKNLIQLIKTWQQLAIYNLRSMLYLNKFGESLALNNDVVSLSWYSHPGWSEEPMASKGTSVDDQALRYHRATLRHLIIQQPA